MRKLSCILCVVILLVLGSNAFAKVKMLDIVYLTDENMVTGEIVEIIPNETIKIKTTDGKLRTHPFDQIEKIDQVEVKLKSRTVATALAAAFPTISGRFTFPHWNTSSLWLGTVLQWSAFKGARFSCQWFYQWECIHGLGTISAGF